MPAPTENEIFSRIMEQLEDFHKHPRFIEYVHKLSNAIAGEWERWRAGMLYGRLNVVGQNLGEWDGIGNGGFINAPTYNLPIFDWYRNTRAHRKFIRELGNEMRLQFARWATSYTFIADPFVGTTTATDMNPGVFTAKMVPRKLEEAGKGTTPSGISPAWQQRLTVGDEPLFRLHHKHCRVIPFMNAVASTIEEKFTTTWYTTLAQASTVQGPSAAHTGQGSGISRVDGIMV